jgi:DNA-binding PadR family transcriptional regulator
LLYRLNRVPRVRRPSPQTVAVLDALARSPRDWRYGYDLCLEVGLQAGTMYPILMRLADRGLLDTSWETDPPAGRPQRHLYRLSADGLAFAATALAADSASASASASESEDAAAPNRSATPTRRGAGSRPSTA